MKNKENVLIDCSYMAEAWEPSISLAIYGIRLIQGFLQYSQYQIHVLVWSDKESIIDNQLGCSIDKIVLDRHDLITRWRPFYKLSGILPKKLKREIRRRNISIVINPFHYGVLFFYPHDIKQIAVVHDMFFTEEERSKRERLSFYLWTWYQSLLLRKFSRIISISKITHDELKQLNHIDSEIVHNSIPLNPAIEEQPVKSVLGEKYILSINRFPKSKNAQTLIRAFALLEDKVPHILYLKGGRDCEEERVNLERLVSELKLENRVIFDIDYRTEGELRYLYSHTDLFVSPSLKEGFGWTPIEAAISKAPVLVSNIEVFQEVLCGKVPTFNPYSPEDLANHIKDILDNPPSDSEREELADFYLTHYSLKNQIMQMEAIMKQ